MSLSSWFIVKIENDRIILDVHPPNRKSWGASILWTSITRICYKTGSFLDSDEIYIFVEGREASYLIPSEASGASILWGEIIQRELFDAKTYMNLIKLDDSIECQPRG